MRQKRNPPRARLQTPRQGHIPFVAAPGCKGGSLPALLVLPRAERSLPGGARDGQMKTFHR